MFNITQKFKKQCATCLEFEPVMHVSKSYANSIPCLIEIEVTCQHRKFCDGIEQTLKGEEKV